MSNYKKVASVFLAIAVVAPLLSLPPVDSRCLRHQRSPSEQEQTPLTCGETADGPPDLDFSGSSSIYRNPRFPPAKASRMCNKQLHSYYHISYI